jgi:hypothetical protein
MKDPEKKIKYNNQSRKKSSGSSCLAMAFGASLVIVVLSLTAVGILWHLWPLLPITLANDEPIPTFVPTAITVATPLSPSEPGEENPNVSSPSNTVEAATIPEARSEADLVIASPTANIVPPTDVPPTMTQPALPTATPDIRLFWDDFETGVKEEWNMRGNNFNSVNGKLTSNANLEGAAGDHSWINYRVILNWQNIGQRLNLRVRVQDDNNYMEVTCNPPPTNRPNRSPTCNWYKVINGERWQIPQTNFHLPQKVAFEIDNNAYRVLDVQNDRILLTFVDNTVSYGGFSLLVEASDRHNRIFILDSIEVYPLP